MTDPPMATLTSTKPTYVTSHPVQTQGTQIVTDVHQDRTSNSMPSTTLTLTTAKPTLTATNSLLTEVTHQGAHVHQEQTNCSQYGSGYVETRHLCIKFHFDEKNFKDAATACSKEGAMLVTIDTEHKMREIWTELNKISGHLQDLWIGGSDVHHTDTFYWQNGVEVGHPYTNWGTHQQQPDEHDHDCIILHRLDNYTWYDEPCYRHYGFICEHPMQVIHTSK
ncbi:hypothetical protein CHS0354_029483 [Potamilus streckersoni]|uniref:C-type lectin domain-containing protein n=1 Tax=Potamilus streckersoni TaxID=2493646 RepID=A0AAE0VRQ1_9BIVA|nr:hypothetical protein CHS0354_029483 [Potamilus streckersoni]